MTFEELGIQTKNKTGTFYTICPKCVDSRKRENRKKECLTVHKEQGNNWFRCHNCMWRGNLESYEKSNAIYSKSFMPKVMPEIYSSPIASFLQKRGISQKTAYEANIYERYVEKWDEYIICYPYYVNHALKNVQFRRVSYVEGVSEGPKHWFIKKEDEEDKPKVLPEMVCWGLQDYDKDTFECIIVEGQTDRLTWLEAGYKNVLSLPSGGLNPGDEVKDKFNFINEDFKRITATCKKFILCTDNDKVGDYTRGLLASYLGKSRCWKPMYPMGYKDSNEVWAGNQAKNLKALGTAGLKEMYDTAKPVPLEGVITIQEVWNDVINLSETGPQKGYLTNDSLIDKYMSIKEKLLMVVTGVPSMGKSTWVRDYTVKLAKNNDNLKFALYTPEQRPPYREYLKISENYVGKSSDPKYMGSMSKDQLMHALSWTGERFRIVSPEKRNFVSFERENPKTLKNLFGYFRTMKYQYGVTGLVVDAYNKIEHERDYKVTEDIYIGMVLDLILEFLDYEDMFLIMVAHPFKMEQLPSGNFLRPNLYSIKGSSAWYERVDIGITVHRDKFININSGDSKAKPKWIRADHVPTIVDITKMKFEELGQEGDYEQYLDYRSGNRFVNHKPQWMIKPQNNDIKPMDSKIIESLQLEFEQDNFPTSDDIPF